MFGKLINWQKHHISPNVCIFTSVPFRASPISHDDPEVPTESVPPGSGTPATWDPASLDVISTLRGKVLFLKDRSDQKIIFSYLFFWCTMLSVYLSKDAALSIIPAPFPTVMASKKCQQWEFFPSSNFTEAKCACCFLTIKAECFSISLNQTISDLNGNLYFLCFCFTFSCSSFLSHFSIVFLFFLLLFSFALNFFPTLNSRILNSLIHFWPLEWRPQPHSSGTDRNSCSTASTLTETCAGLENLTLHQSRQDSYSFSHEELWLIWVNLSQAVISVLSACLSGIHTYLLPKK